MHLVGITWRLHVILPRTTTVCQTKAIRVKRTSIMDGVQVTEPQYKIGPLGSDLIIQKQIAVFAVRQISSMTKVRLYFRVHMACMKFVVQVSKCLPKYNQNSKMYIFVLNIPNPEPINP